MRFPLIFVIMLSALGCSQTVTRTMTMSPSAAAQLNPNVRVVSFDHEGQHRSASGVMTSSTTVRTGAGEQVELSADDEVTVQVTYRAGDEVSGEGVVRSEKVRAPILASGIAVLLTVPVLAGVGAAINSCYRAENWLGVDCLKESFTAMTLWTIAGVSGAVGLALILVGLTPHTYVDRTSARPSSHVELVPVVARGGGGAMVQMTW